MWNYGCPVSGLVGGMDTTVAGSSPAHSFMKLLKIKTAYFNLDHLLYADILPVEKKGFQLTMVFNSTIGTSVGLAAEQKNFKIDMMLTPEQRDIVKAVLDTHLVLIPVE